MRTRWHAVLVWIVFGSLLALLVGFGNIAVMLASVLVGLIALWLLCVTLVVDGVAKLIDRR